jgi:hypothetical protein
MNYKVVNPETLALELSYQAEESLQSRYGGPWGYYPHLPVPEGLDADCVKAVLVDDVITLVEDTDKVTAKAQAAKLAQVAALKDALDAEIYAQMATVFQTSKSDSASAYLETWKLMLEAPEDYVAVAGVADAAAVTAYAQGKLDEAKIYSIWRLQKINEYLAAKAAILA